MERITPLARIVVIGSKRWKDTRQTTAALRKVMELYRPPYVLLHDGAEGAARYAAVNALRLGWEVEPHEVDITKCTAQCPPAGDHRRKGGPAGDYCPLGRKRALLEMLDAGADLVLVFVTTADSRLGQREALRRGIGVWEFVKGGTNRGNA